MLDIITTLSLSYSLKLADILLKPTQRLMKYSLLLQAIRKNAVDDDWAILDSMVCITK